MFQALIAGGIKYWPEAAPDEANYFDLEYERGDIVALNGKRMSPMAVLAGPNRQGRTAWASGGKPLRRHEVAIATKPRAAPLAQGAIELITLDRELAHLWDDLMPRYVSLIYNGYRWVPERGAADSKVLLTKERDRCETNVTGKLPNDT